MLEEYVNRIQELEAELQQLHQAKARPGSVPRTVYSVPPHIDGDTASGAVLRVPEVDGDVLSPGTVSSCHYISTVCDYSRNPLIWEPLVIILSRNSSALD